MNSSTGNDDCQSKTSTIVDNAFAVDHSAAAPVAQSAGTTTSGGFCMVPWEVVDAQLSPTELAAYVALVRHRNKSGHAHPSMDTIARVAGMTPRTARKAVAELVKRGLIRREFRKKPSGDHDTPMYFIPRGTERNSVGTEINSPGVRHLIPQGTEINSAKVEPIKNNYIEVEEEKTRRNAAAVDDSIPESLNTPEFQAVWKNWESHRQEIRKPLKPTSRKTQLEKLAALGPSRAVAAIQYSLANGWQGIFEPKPERINGTATPAARPVQALKQLKPAPRKERTQ